MQIFIVAEGLKIEFFFALSGGESSLVLSFCESCVHLDRDYPSICPHDSKICDSSIGVHSSRGLGGGEACTKFMMYSTTSLVPSPPPQLSSLAVRKTRYLYCKRR